MTTEVDVDELFEVVKRAIEAKKPVYIVKQLVSLNPKVVQVGSDYSTLLHLACQHYHSDDVIEYLIQLHRDAVIAKDERDSTPLHTFLLNRGFSLEVIKMLTHDSPLVLCMTNDSGQTPLWIACEQGAPTAVIDYLANLAPVACLMQDDEKELPFSLVGRGYQHRTTTLTKRTRDAAGAFIEAVLTRKEMIDWAGFAHVLTFVPGTVAAGVDDSEIMEEARASLNDFAIAKILDNDIVQDLLKTEYIQKLICEKVGSAAAVPAVVRPELDGLIDSGDKETQDAIQAMSRLDSATKVRLGLFMAADGSAGAAELEQVLKLLPASIWEKLPRSRVGGKRKRENDSMQLKCVDKEDKNNDTFDGSS